MTSLIIGLGVILLIAILYLVFRLGSLIGIAKGGEREPRVDGANKINAALFLVFMVGSLGLFFWYSYTRFDEYTLPVASEHGRWIDSIFWITMAVTVASFVIISIIMFWFAYKYQYKEGRKAKFYPDNHILELTWTVIPALVLAVLIFTGLSAWNKITSAPSADAEVIEVVGQQFAWLARYPGKDNELGKYDFRKIDSYNEFGLDLQNDKNTYDDFKAVELHLPANKEILLKIRAKDVLHSVFLPHFRVKMDAVPGMPTHFKFKVEKTTAQMRSELKDPNFNYEMACVEICGRGHFTMRMPVVVDDLETYERWKDSQESWLKQNPDYLKNVPPAMREAAMIKAGIPVEAGVSAIQGNMQSVEGSN